MSPSAAVSFLTSNVDNKSLDPPPLLQTFRKPTAPEIILEAKPYAGGQNGWISFEH